MKSLLGLIPYLKRHKKKILLGFFFVTVSNIFTAIIPRLIGGAIDAIVAGAMTMPEVFVAIALIMGATIGSGFFMFLTRRTIIVASRLIEYELRDDLLTILEKLPLRYFQRTPTGELMAHATNDISAIRNFLGPAIMYTANTLTAFIFALTMMFLISPLITLLALAPLPLISYTTYRIGAKVHVIFRDVQDQYAKLTAWAQENMSGVRVVRSYVREIFEVERFTAMGKSYFDKNIRLTKVQALSMPSMMILVGLSQTVVLGVGGHMVMQGQATYGILVQFFMYLNMLVWPVIAIGWVTNIVQRAAASMGRLAIIFDEKIEIGDSVNTDSSITTINGAIDFQRVHFRYSSAYPEALSDVSFNIKAGETIGIVGETGSGKSTLINLLPRLFDISGGRILIDGVDIRSIPLQTLRRNIAVVPQESFLFSASIDDNVRFGNPDATWEDVLKASEIAQLDKDVRDFPEGYETIVGERGVTLSGGQKQRTAIARALVRKPAILIFDDALSAVDTETEEKILQGLQREMTNRTSIIIAHRISTVKNADRILAIHNQRIAENGTHEELLRLGGLYADMYNRQLLEEEIELM